MTYPVHLARPVVLKARRETILLVAGAMTITFALAHLVETHRPAPNQAAMRSNVGRQMPQQAWTGELAGLTTAGTAGDAIEPLTSASLVVPQAELALPQPTIRPLMKLRGCAGQTCAPKVVVALGPVPRPAGAGAGMAERRVAAHGAKSSLMSRLNPLNHLPDTTTIKRPFAIASDTVSGWFKRF